MKKTLCAVFLSLICASCALLTIRDADEPSDFERGVAAFDAGNFDAAEKYLRPEAQKGNADAQRLLDLMTPPNAQNASDYREPTNNLNWMLTTGRTKDARRFEPRPASPPLYPAR